MNGGDLNESAAPVKSTAPITRDLLGGCCTLDSKELDLDLQVPCGWEKRLDLKSGKVYIQRCKSSPSSSSTSEPKPDLNFPPKSSKPTTLTLFDDASLDMELVAPLHAVSSPSNYQSVCTLDKVKSALERAEKEIVIRKRSISISRSQSKSSSPTQSTSSSSVDLDREEKSTASIAAGCPGCLLYVLISRSNPKCPRCNNEVPLPGSVKKPRIDLNMSI
ncbi:Unknown protein [Striga hermonthica]|uniref:GIR1-like zinc ribbon domain-containing protein n=1 Tax=Striga hermonthica TaxID=68872 RepID=A0A9N7RA84_STRHE|nr:Unknown protein [Striga hermonthica]